MGMKFNYQIPFILIFVSFMFSVNMGFAEDPVEFADSKLKEAVENELNNQENPEGPTPEDMGTLSWLPYYYQWESIGIYDINDLAGLEHAVNLEALGIQSSSISNFSVLSELKNLQNLMLASCEISDLSALVSAISNLEKLESLSLKDNQISDIALLSDFNSLKTLNLQNNPLNEMAYEVYIPQIRKNNPGIEIAIAFRTEQLIRPTIVFAAFIMATLFLICRDWKARGWIFELLTGILSAAVGCFLGLGSQILYVYTDSFIEFFGNGYENPPWVGGTIGGVLGLLVGVWFAQHLRGRLNGGQSRGRIVGKGILVGIGLGVLCSTAVHILLMVAYHNLDFRPLLIGAVFGIGGGIATGLVISVAFILANKWGLIKTKEKI